MRVFSTTLVPAKREQELHESFLNFDTEVCELTADALLVFMNDTHLNKA